MTYKIATGSISIGQPPRFRIMCAVCKRPVDRAEQWRRLVTHHITFEVYCHGAKETVTLSYEDIMNTHSITVEEAFTTRSIT